MNKQRRKNGGVKWFPWSKTQKVLYVQEVSFSTHPLPYLTIESSWLVYYQACLCKLSD